MWPSWPQAWMTPSLRERYSALSAVSLRGCAGRPCPRAGRRPGGRCRGARCHLRRGWRSPRERRDPAGAERPLRRPRCVAPRRPVRDARAGPAAGQPGGAGGRRSARRGAAPWENGDWNRWCSLGAVAQRLVPFWRRKSTASSASGAQTGRCRGRSRPRICVPPRHMRPAMNPSSSRQERDFLGARSIPATAYWGVHTVRAVENFPISGQPLSGMPELVRALAFVKQAAAQTNATSACSTGSAQASSSPPATTHRRAIARAVRRRRDPGRRRHLDQHERQRGDRQPRARVAGPPARRATTPAPDRPRQHVAEHERRLPDRASNVDLLRLGALLRRDGRAAASFRGQGRRVRDVLKIGPHPIAGRGADDAGPGVHGLRGDAGRGQRAWARRAR